MGDDGGPNTPRLFTAGALAAGAEVAGTPGQAHYLGRVMRREVGDRVRLFNGRDGEFSARIVTLQKEKASFLPERRTREPISESDLWLVFSPLKRDATDLVVQKATELGVSALWPVFCERTSAGRVSLERMAAIAMEASEQCERLSVPAVHPPARLFDVIAAWPAERLLAVAAERLAGPSLLALAGQRPGALLVGPEGGFSGAELDALRAAPFVALVSLGPRILRAETAAIAGLALLQARSGITEPADPAATAFQEPDVQPR